MRPAPYWASPSAEVESAAQANMAAKEPAGVGAGFDTFDVDTGEGGNRAAEHNEQHVSEDGHWGDARHNPITEIPPMWEPGAAEALVAAAARVGDHGRLVLFTTSG